VARTERRVESRNARRRVCRPSLQDDDVVHQALAEALQRPADDFKIKELTEEEDKLWEKDRYDVMFKIVEHYSMIEFVKNVPRDVQARRERPDAVRPVKAFHPHLKKGKNGQLYIDEYEMNEGKRKQDIEHAEALRLLKSHEDYDEKLGRVLTEEEVLKRGKPPTEEGDEDDLPDVLIE
jgi:hypothetical protein